MGSFGQGILTIALAIVGLAILSVVVSRNADTKGVITSAGNAFSGALKAATGPVSGYGGGFSPSTSTYGLGQ